MERESDPTRLEILRMAHDLVVGEYNNRRAETHNQWLVESDRLWKTSRVRLAYPPIPPFPAEEEIMIRAQALIDFVGSNKDPQSSDASVAQSQATSAAEPPQPKAPSADELPSVLKKIERMRTKLEGSIGGSNG
jgi:hypothetical protein